MSSPCCHPTRAHSSSTASGYRNGVYLLLFINCILYPHKASVTQNTAPPQPAQLHSTWLPAATLHSPGSCKNWQHLLSTETLAISETGIPSGLLLYLYCYSLPSRSSQDLRNAQSEAEDCPQLLTALTIAQQCFSSPTPSAATRVTLRLSGHTGFSLSDLQIPLLCSAARIRGGFFSSRRKQSTSTLCAPTTQGGFHLKNSPTR